MKTRERMRSSVSRLKRDEDEKKIESSDHVCGGWKRKATKLEGRTVPDQPTDIRSSVAGYTYPVLRVADAAFLRVIWKIWIDREWICVKKNCKNRETNSSTIDDNSWIIIFKKNINMIERFLLTSNGARGCRETRRNTQVSFFFKVSSTFVFPVESFMEIIRVWTFMEIYATFFPPTARRNIYLLQVHEWR